MMPSSSSFNALSALPSDDQASSNVDIPSEGQKPSEDEILEKMEIIHNENTRKRTREEEKLQSKTSASRQRRKQQENDSQKNKNVNFRQRCSEEPIPQYLVVRSIGSPSLTEKLQAREINQVLNDAIGEKYIFNYSKIKCVRIKDETVAKIGPVIEPNKARKFMELTRVQHKKQDVISEYKIKIERDATRNKSEGIIVDWNNMFADMEDDEVASSLKDQGVQGAFRFTKGPNKQKLKTIKLTFITMDLPPSIKFHGYWYPTKVYIPLPQRCFRCQNYGHSQSSCRSSVEVVCNNCGTSGHQSEMRDKDNKVRWKCTESTKCCHCKGNHPAGHKECPRYLKEKKICEEMAVNNLSKAEAKAKVNQNEPERTTAEVVRTTTPLPNSNDQTNKQQMDSLKGMIEEILERKLSTCNPDEMMRKILSLEEERKKDKETIEHLRQKQISQQNPQPPSSKNETDEIKRRLEKLELENKQLKEVQAENAQMKKELEDLKKKQKNLLSANEKLKAKEKPNIKQKNETEENNSSYKNQKSRSSKNKKNEEIERPLLKQIEAQAKEIKQLKAEKPIEGSLLKQIDVQSKEIDKLRDEKKELKNQIPVQGEKEKELLQKWGETIPFLEDQSEKTYNPPGNLKPPVLDLGNLVPNKLTPLGGTKPKTSK